MADASALLGARGPGRRPQASFLSSPPGRALLIVLGLIGGLVLLTRFGAAHWAEAQTFTRVSLDSGVRIVPGGSSIRDGQRSEGATLPGSKLEQMKESIKWPSQMKEKG